MSTISSILDTLRSGYYVFRKHTAILRYGLAFMHPNNRDPYSVLLGKVFRTLMQVRTKIILFFTRTVEENGFANGKRIKYCVVATSHFISFFQMRL